MSACSPRARTSTRWPRCPTSTWSALRRAAVGVGRVARIPKPVVAAVTGYALGGGCELALCADVRVRAEDARARPAGDPARRHPGRGRHAAALPPGRPGRAKDIIFTGRFVDAEEALAIGPGRPGRARPTRCTRGRGVGAAVRQRPGVRPARGEGGRSTAVSRSTWRPGWRSSGSSSRRLFATEDRTIGMRSFVENGPARPSSSDAEVTEPTRLRSPTGTTWPKEPE